MKLLLRLSALAALAALSLVAQAVRVDPNPVMTTAGAPGAGGTAPLLAVAGAKVAICNFPANGTPCTNYAATYTDATAATPCPSTSQVVLAGTSACVASADAQGNYGFWIVPGTYAYTITTPAGTSYGPYTLTLGITSGAVSYNPGATGSIARSTQARLQDIRTFKDFNCLGTGPPADDTACVQAAVNWATAVTAGRRLMCPEAASTYAISSTIVIQNVAGFALEGGGYGCTFLWTGASTTSPVFDLQDVANSTFKNFEVLASSANPAEEAFRIENGPGGTVSPTGNKFENVYIEGSNGYFTYGFRGYVGAGGDANVDFMYFDNVRVMNYAHSAWSIEGTQSDTWRMVNCQAVAANATGKYAVSGGTSSAQGGASVSNFTWDGGLVANNTIADFFLGQTSSPALAYDIRNVSSEGSSRFLSTIGPSGYAPITIDNVRFAANGLNSDGYALYIQLAGPVAIRNSHFGDDSGAWAKNVKMLWNPDTVNAMVSMVLEDVVFYTALTTASAIFRGVPPTAVLGSRAQSTNTVGFPLDYVNLSGNVQTNNATAGYLAPGTSTFAGLPSPAFNGMHVYCSNCDAPASQGATCTSASGMAGAQAVRVRGAWQCY